MPANDDIITSSSPGNWTVDPGRRLQRGPRQPADPRDQHAQVGALVLDDHLRRSRPRMAAMTVLPNGVACSTGPTPLGRAHRDLTSRSTRIVSPSMRTGKRRRHASAGLTPLPVRTSNAHSWAAQVRTWRPERSLRQRVGEVRAPVLVGEAPRRRCCTAGRRRHPGSRRASRPPRARRAWPASSQSAHGASPPLDGEDVAVAQSCLGDRRLGSSRSPASLRTVGGPGRSGADPQAASWAANWATVRSFGCHDAPGQEVVAQVAEQVDAHRRPLAVGIGSSRQGSRPRRRSLPVSTGAVEAHPLVQVGELARRLPGDDPVDHVLVVREPGTLLLEDPAARLGAEQVAAAVRSPACTRCSVRVGRTAPEAGRGCTARAARRTAFAPRRLPPSCARADPTAARRSPPSPGTSRSTIRARRRRAWRRRTTASCGRCRTPAGSCGVRSRAPR